MIPGSRLVLVGCLVILVGMTVTCTLGATDPFPTARWRYRTMCAGLVVSIIGCVALYAGMIPLVIHWLTT